MTHPTTHVHVHGGTDVSVHCYGFCSLLIICGRGVYIYSRMMM